MLRGGVRQVCVDRGLVDESYLSKGSAAGLFKKPGFEANLYTLNRLVNTPKVGNMTQVFAASSPMSIDETHHHSPQEGAREDFNKETINNWGGWAWSPPPTAPPTSTTW
jgi:hypothetical protein